MALGPTIRRLLGPRLSRVAACWYRAIFVDLDKVADALAAVIPRDSHLLDVGGGDGEVLNHLLTRRPDVRVTTLDTAATVGRWLLSRFEAQVHRLPATSLAEYLGSGRSDPQVVLFADVMHHIPPASRAGVLGCLSALLDRVTGLKIIVKDLEPGSWRARLGYWSDRYVTGDRNVRFISREDLVRLFEKELGPLRHEETGLFEQDAPNYAIVFYR